MGRMKWMHTMHVKARDCRWYPFCGVAVAVALFTQSRASATSFPEIEPNESKAAATVANGLNDGDALTGFCSGATTSPGSNSVDYFRVTLATRPLAIYRHRLTITTFGSAGHAGTLRGLVQTDLGIDTIESQIQVSIASTNPPRMNQWYGFGKGESFYYRIGGIPGTTSDYASTLSTDVVMPTAIAGPLSAGQITITTIGQGHTTDTELWVYDANLNALPDFGNDDESAAGGGPGLNLVQSILRRTYAPGVYYLAVSDYNLCNNLVSPPDDQSPRDGPVMDFPNLLVARQNAPTINNVSFTISDSAGHSYPTPAIRPGPYEAAWFTFTVSSAGCVCRGDLSGDNTISTADVEPFVASMLSGTPDNCADVDQDGAEDGRDVQPFVQAVIAGTCP